MARPITGGGIPTPVYNLMKSNQAARTRHQEVNRGNIQRNNATMLNAAKRNYKNAPTKAVQNIIGVRIKNLEKRPVR